MFRKLKALRAMKNENQQDVAKLIGVSISTYNRKENGHLEFTINEINKILKHYDKSYEDVFMN